MSVVVESVRDGTNGYVVAARDGAARDGSGGRGGVGGARGDDGTGGRGSAGDRRDVRRDDEADRGSVTVEGAITVCSLIVVLGLVLGVVTATMAQVRCADAAGEAARLLGRGDDGRAREAVRRLAPDGATLTSSGDGPGVAVTVRSPLLGGLLPGIELSAEAYAVREPAAETEGDGAGVEAG